MPRRPKYVHKNLLFCLHYDAKTAEWWVLDSDRNQEPVILYGKSLGRGGFRFPSEAQRDGMRSYWWLLGRKPKKRRKKGEGGSDPSLELTAGLQPNTVCTALHR